MGVGLQPPLGPGPTTHPICDHLSLPNSSYENPAVQEVVADGHERANWRAMFPFTLDFSCNTPKEGSQFQVADYLALAGLAPLRHAPDPARPGRPVALVPKRIKGGFFVRERLGHIAAPGLGSPHPTRAGGVPCDPAPPACPGRRVSPMGRSLPHRLPAEVASISSPSPRRHPRPGVAGGRGEAPGSRWAGASR